MAITDSLVAYYECEENAASTTVSDSHASNDGTAEDNTDQYNTTGIIADGFDFVAANSEGFKTDSTSLLNGSGAFSVQVWINPDAGASGDGLVTTRGTTFHGFYFYNTTLIGFFTDNNQAVASSIPDMAGTWHHIVGTYDGTTTKIFVDGVYKGNNTGASGNLAVNDSWWIGQDDFGGRWFNGVIDEVLLSSRALTDGGIALGQTAGGEIAELYNSGSGLAYPFTAPAVGNLHMMGANF